MNKFENVDVLASLQQIMQQNTAAFQNDFDIDKKILTQAAKSKNAENKVYLWFSRPNGTHCLRERDVFLRGTREHNTFRFYHEQTKERVLAYAVVLSGMESGKVTGCFSVYARKMLIDGYVIRLDYSDMKAMTAELQKIGTNINQIAKRVNATGTLYAQDIEDIKGAMAEIWQLQRSILSKAP